MKGTELKVRFIGDKAYLTEDKSIDLQQLNLPKIVSTFSLPAYWNIKVLGFTPTEKKLFVDVLAYNVGECEFDTHQLESANTLSEISSITFKSIDTNGLLNSSRGTRSITLKPKIERITREDYHKIPFKRTLKAEFSIPLKKVRFNHGFISFEKKFGDYKKRIELQIRNDAIREEFDAIKNYFANIFKTKRIRVSATIEITDDIVTSVDCMSPEIASITKDTLDNVRIEYVKSTIKRSNQSDLNKNLFTMEEYFDTFSSEIIKASTIYKNEHEFVDDLVKITKTKHHKQLEYLSKKHDHNTMKLRFLHRPLSFMFLIHGSKYDHIVWETLDTKEATYVWPISKDKPKAREEFKKIECNIKTILEDGKLVYINSEEASVTRIRHDYTTGINGFLDWKKKLEKLLL